MAPRRCGGIAGAATRLDVRLDRRRSTWAGAASWGRDRNPCQTFGTAHRPVRMATNRHVVLRSWSAFTLNLPFSKLAIVVGDPIVVPEDAGAIELEASRLAVEHGLNDVTTCLSWREAATPLPERGEAGPTRRRA